MDRHLSLSNEEEAALRQCARADGLSAEDAVVIAVRTYIKERRHRDDVAATAEEVIAAQGEVLKQLGE